MKIPELLVPAGTFQKMRYGLAYGADAIYAGVPRFSLRARENDFTESRLREAIDYVHKRGKKIYLTMNIYPHNRKIDAFLNILAAIAQMDMDGLIMADPGMIMLTREKYPHIPIHLSTQANTINWPAVRFWQKIGLRRIILSRELSLDEIREIRQKVPDIELEAFIHGAICIAYSGRCLLSNYFNHRDANQGTCTNACRWEYRLYQENTVNDPSADDGEFFIEEAERPGELMPIDEDEHGTYIMNSKDLCTISILDQMIDAGLDSLKIEGRTKSIYYLSIITRAYRKALDALNADQPVPSWIRDEVNAIANRGYTTGFLERNPLHEGQNYEQSQSDNHSKTFAGEIKKWDEVKKRALIEVRGRFQVNDLLELVSPQQTRSFRVTQITDEEGNILNAAHGGGQDVWIDLPFTPSDYALLRRPRQQSKIRKTNNWAESIENTDIDKRGH